MEDPILLHFNEALEVLKRAIAEPEFATRIRRAGVLMSDAIAKGNKIIACGNGGSMCDAMHFAEELSGRYRNDRRALPAVSISDSSHISCVANDYGYEFVFSRYVEALGQEGDVLLAISTSGKSPNVVRAAQAARDKDMYVVALTGNGGGELAALSNVEIRVPHYGFADRIQEVHIKVIHSLIDYIELHTI